MSMVAERIAELLATYTGLDRSLTSNRGADLVHTLDFDGLDFVDFALICEENFGVVLDDVADALSTVGDWITTIEARV